MITFPDMTKLEWPVLAGVFVLLVAAAYAGYVFFGGRKNSSAVVATPATEENLPRPEAQVQHREEQEQNNHQQDHRQEANDDMTNEQAPV
jgi:flagellar basal body-associated protein FliL